MENKDNWIVKYQHGSGIYLPFNEEKQYFPVSYEIVDMLRERDTLLAENERLTNALNMLRTSITQAPGMQSQEDNWMLGIIDTALGDGPAADRPHPLAPVEVE